MVQYVTKRQYIKEEEKYLAWCKIIQRLTFGRLDLSDAVDEIMKDKIIINI